MILSLCNNFGASSLNAEAKLSKPGKGPELCTKICHWELKVRGLHVAPQLPGAWLPSFSGLYKRPLPSTLPATFWRAFGALLVSVNSTRTQSTANSKLWGQKGTIPSPAPQDYSQAPAGLHYGSPGQVIQLTRTFTVKISKNQMSLEKRVVQPVVTPTIVLLLLKPHSPVATVTIHARLSRTVLILHVCPRVSGSTQVPARDCALIFWFDKRSLCP